MIGIDKDVSVERLVRAPQRIDRRPLSHNRWRMQLIETAVWGFVLGAAGATAAWQFALLMWGAR